MSFVTRRLLPAATLLIALASAQTCYYPDGKTVSTGDVPCDSSAPASACCASNSFCYANGLCYGGGGLVTRGSCTDKTWGSAECPQYCQNVDTSSILAITACTSDGSSNTFACGVNTTDCQTDANTFTLSSSSGLVLRPNQIATLVGQAVTSAAPSSSSSSGGYSAGVLAGVAIGVAAPLLIALAIMFWLLHREKRTFSKPKLLYRLPDEVERDDFTFTPPPAVRTTSAFSSNRSSHTTNTTAASTIASRRASKLTFGSLQAPKPVAPQSFMERYETMKKHAQSQVSSREDVVSPHMIDIGISRHELESPSKEIPRYELPQSRMSR